MTGRILLIFPSFPPSLLYSCSTRWGVCWISILLLRHISALPLPVLTFSLFPSLFLLPFPLTERNKHVTAHIWPVLSGPRNCTFLFRKVQWGSNDINSGLLFHAHFFFVLGLLPICFNRAAWTPQTFVQPDDHVLQHALWWSKEHLTICTKSSDDQNHKFAEIEMFLIHFIPEIFHIVKS